MGLSGSFLTTHANAGIDIFLETLLHPTFPTDEVDKRRREILLALKNREDDLAQVAFDLFYQTLYETHPYRFLTIGSEASLNALTQDRIAGYYKALLDPTRLVVSVVGDVDTSLAIDRLSAGLSALPAVASPSAPEPESRPTTTRTVTKSADKQQAHVVLGFHGVTLDNPDRYALKVLDTILSRQGGRLFYEVAGTARLGLFCDRF